MTRDELKQAHNDLIDSIITENRELSDEDQDNLNDNINDATIDEMIASAEDDKDVTEEKADAK